MTGRLRVAIVGAGLAARSHALDIVTDDTMELTGIVGAGSPSAAAMADTFGGIAYQCLDAMLEDAAVDGVVVAVPPQEVFKVLERVAQVGKPCLAEKPIATSGAHLRLLKQFSSEDAAVVAPFNRRYAPHVSQARMMIAAGEIGEITAVDAVWRGPYDDRFGPDGGTYRAFAGPREGVLLDSGSHALDAISLLLGDIAGACTGPVSLTCNQHGAEIAGDASFTIGPVSVTLGLIDVPAGPTCGGWHVRVQGTRGAVTVDERRCVIEKPQGTTEVIALAGEMTRPVSDLNRLSEGGDALGTGLREIADLSDLVIAIYSAASPGRAPWRRPRGKALGRLNGAC